MTIDRRALAERLMRVQPVPDPAGQGRTIYSILIDQDALQEIIEALLGVTTQPQERN